MHENNIFLHSRFIVHVRLDFLMLYWYCYVYLTVDPETNTHQNVFDLISFPFIGKPVLYNTEHDKKIYFFINFIFNRRLVVNQDHYMHVCKVTLSKFCFLAHVFQDPPLCSNTALCRVWLNVVFAGGA